MPLLIVLVALTASRGQDGYRLQYIIDVWIASAQTVIRIAFHSGCTRAYNFTLAHTPQPRCPYRLQITIELLYDLRIYVVGRSACPTVLGAPATPSS